MSLALVRRWALGFYVRQKSPSPQPSPCMYRTHGGQVFGDMVDTF